MPIDEKVYQEGHNVSKKETNNSCDNMANNQGPAMAGFKVV